MEKKRGVYMLRCGDGSLYTGWAADADARLELHRQGKGAKYTRGRSPLTMVYFFPCDDRGEALKKEYAIKQLSHEEKLALIASAENALGAEEAQTDEK
ncbi:MAG: GIY-YIG nuclease family protein [Christensenellaceae bacterium]|nr:GIY-YIG nuclease family protein [Christensenellaceae bacterium]